MRDILAALRADRRKHGARTTAGALFVVRAVWSRHCAVRLNNADTKLDSSIEIRCFRLVDMSHDAVDIFFTGWTVEGHTRSLADTIVIGGYRVACTVDLLPNADTASLLQSLLWYSSAVYSR